ncbi:hypothetical protein PHLCEN_2v9051 [Hermanssonia centrifuga]|uniref:UvrD-like helicase C-terminal domain-containing protein n=1 Tax=Hermanssonia centrifuga TaxID=98765 RepID=A0A2R6NRU4_9APHY|nr:hypothetical protein PHLCEN_2v9051 [Hermanssonia centrifuga]
MNSASRGIENALQKEGIPNRLLGGHRFFERMEVINALTPVKDLLAYLQVIDNPKFIPAFTRIINIPGRGIGEKTIAKILQKAGSLKISPLEVVERIHDGKLADIKPPVKRKIGSFVQAMKKLRKLARDGEYPEQLIRQLLDLIKYQDHLKKTQQDFEGRWDNVQELINFATEFESSAVLDAAEALSNKLALARTESQEDDWMDATEYDDLDDLGFPDAKEAKRDKDKARQVILDGEETPLRAFLQASMLSTDTETNEDEETKKDKVTIATCHAAKGLEWPVVFVPAVEKGVFPSARADDIEEERRLLYVACTRAQGFLYLSHCAVRMAMGQSTDKELSEFITAVQRAEVRLFRDSISDVTSQDRATIAAVLNRPVPEADKVKKMIEE